MVGEASASASFPARLIASAMMMRESVSHMHNTTRREVGTDDEEPQELAAEAQGLDRHWCAQKKKKTTKWCQACARACGKGGGSVV